MGVFPFVQQTDLCDSEEIVETSAFGSVKVNIFGNSERYPIVTFHDIGLNAIANFENFFQFQTFSKLTEHFCVYNINAPGQELDARKLPENFHYPTMDGLASIVGDVVSHFGFKSFIGIGVGAGANVLLRFAMSHQNVLDALLLINATSQKAGWVEWAYQRWNVNSLRSERMTRFTVDYLMWHHFGKHFEECNPDIVQQYRDYFYSHPNPSNLALYIETFLNRNELSLRDPKSTSDFLLKVPVLQIVGINSAFINESVYVNSQLNPRTSEWMKISDSCGLVLDDKPIEIMQAMFLFLQGLGFCPSIEVYKLTNKIKEEREGKRRGSDNSATVEWVDEQRQM
ncbi:hypothetical protein niasHT_007420 [Heterodera trifolii]|uniref:Protein NDRG3 n=1 Tax=Heterodera trifolii TaxID=157864 RepID=A0ABD2LLK2_9BILA